MISEDIANKLRITLMTGGWRDFMVPSGARRGKAALDALALNKEERHTAGGPFKDKTDDELRAVIQESEWWLSVWSNELKMFDFNRQQDELLGRSNGGEPAIPNTANP